LGQEPTSDTLPLTTVDVVLEELTGDDASWITVLDTRDVHERSWHHRNVTSLEYDKYSQWFCMDRRHMHNLFTINRVTHRLEQTYYYDAENVLHSSADAFQRQLRMFYEIRLKKTRSGEYVAELTNPDTNGDETLIQWVLHREYGHLPDFDRHLRMIKVPRPEVPFPPPGINFGHIEDYGNWKGSWRSALDGSWRSAPLKIFPHRSTERPMYCFDGRLFQVDAVREDASVDVSEVDDSDGVCGHPGEESMEFVGIDSTSFRKGVLPQMFVYTDWSQVHVSPANVFRKYIPPREWLEEEQIVPISRNDIEETMIHWASHPFQFTSYTLGDVLKMINVLIAMGQNVRELLDVVHPFLFNTAAWFDRSFGFIVIPPDVTVNADMFTEDAWPVIETHFHPDYLLLDVLCYVVNLEHPSNPLHALWHNNCAGILHPTLRTMALNPQFLLIDHLFTAVKTEITLGVTVTDAHIAAIHHNTGALFLRKVDPFKGISTAVTHRRDVEFVMTDLGRRVQDTAPPVSSMSKVLGRFSDPTTIQDVIDTPGDIPPDHIDHHVANLINLAFLSQAQYEATTTEQGRALWCPT
jgi:hypothetical protein